MITSDRKSAKQVEKSDLSQYLVTLNNWQIHPTLEEIGPRTTTLKTILELGYVYKRTMDSVTGNLGQLFGSSGMQWSDTRDLRPALDSPANILLRRFITGLSKQERAKLLALGWLGQGYDGDDWPALLEKAEQFLSDDPSRDLTYLISKFSLFELGLTKLENWIARQHVPPSTS